LARGAKNTRQAGKGTFQVQAMRIDKHGEYYHFPVVAGITPVGHTELLAEQSTWPHIWGHV
jgi:hypothetical protein